MEVCECGERNGVRRMEDGVWSVRVGCEVWSVKVLEGWGWVEV